jgi:drug/metabolite transporter (DMT)-like permease
LLIPLVAIVESYLLLRPEVGWEMWAGMALMLAGGVGLLRSTGDNKMSLRVV